MNEKIWKKIDYVVGLLPIGVIFGLLVLVANIEIKDLDLWLHLAMGKYILQHQFVPGYDVLSCSIAGKQWINHEWLFQVIVYKIFSLWGPEGLIKMQAVVVTVTMFILLLIGYNKERQLLLSFMLFLLYLLYQQRFTIRPDIFSLLFFAIFIFVLALHIDKRWSIFVLFITQVLWSNIHGFFFFGPLFVAIGLFSEWVKRNVALPFEWNESGRLTDEEYGRLKKIFIFVILACLVNIYTFKGAWYPVSVLFSLSGDNKIFFDYIQELQKPILWSNIWDRSSQGHYKLFILISFLSFIFNRRRIDISALLFWIIFLVFSLKASRNIAFFAFAAYLVFMTNMVNVSSKDLIPLRFVNKKFEYLTSIVLKFLFIAWIFSFGRGIYDRGYYDFDKYEIKKEFRGGVTLRSYPSQAVDFLVHNNIKGNFFNDFNSGAYLLGRCYPNIKVFIDGRTEVYGAKFFQMYQKVWEEGDFELFKKLANQYHITGALLNSTRSHIPQRILKAFYQDKDWKVVYFDYDAVIFLRDVPENQEWIKKYTIDLTQWKPKKLDLFRLGAVSVTAYQNFYRAYTLDSLGLSDQALLEAKEAVKVTPAYAESYQLLSKIYAGKMQYQKAFEYSRQAAALSPYNKNSRLNLAMAYMDVHHYKGAIEQYKEVTILWPTDPKGFFLLAKAYAKDTQYDEAIKVLLQAHKMDKNDAMDLIKIGDIIFEQQAYTKAVKVYELALLTNRELGQIHEKLAKVFEAMGQSEQAHKESQKAAEIKASQKAQKASK